MTLDDLKQYDLIYLATPFTKYKEGLYAAHIAACHLASRLMQRGILHIRCPIAEAYPIAWHGCLNPLDLKIWQPFCDASLIKCDLLLIGELPGYMESEGIQHEINCFELAGKPVFSINPDTLELRRA